MNKQEIAETVEVVGLEESLLKYINSSEIEDEELSLMWHHAADLLRSIQNMLG